MSVTKIKVQVLASPQELQLIDEVVPKRKRSRFLIETAVEKAKTIKRQLLEKQIREAFEIDGEFFQSEAKKWESAELEGAIKHGVEKAKKSSRRTCYC